MTYRSSSDSERYVNVHISISNCVPKHLTAPVRGCSSSFPRSCKNILTVGMPKDDWLMATDRSNGKRKGRRGRRVGFV